MAIVNALSQSAANRLCQQLRDQLNGALTINDPTVGTDGIVSVVLGAGTAGAAGALIVFAPDTLIGDTSIGTTPIHYSPSLLQIGFEKHASIAGFAIPADTVSLQSQIIAVAGRMGYEIDVFLTPNAAFPVAAEFTAANQVSRIRPNVRNGMLGQN